jgi:DNA repair protein RecO (recombination protein O)
MLTTARAIVLKTIRHGDRTVVLKAWTDHHGLRGYLVRAGGRRGQAMAALQPLNRLEVVADEHPERELHPVRELRVERPYQQLHNDPLRISVALFVQELLYRTLRQEAADEALDHYVRHALEILDTAPDVRNFPVVFLVQLSGHLGFFPEAAEEGEDRFDMMEGRFTAQARAHGHTLGPPLSTALAGLLERPLAEQHLAALPARLRRDLLDHLLLYFRLHLDGLGPLRSPEVLHQVLA